MRVHDKEGIGPGRYCSRVIGCHLTQQTRVQVCWVTWRTRSARSYRVKRHHVHVVDHEDCGDAVDAEHHVRHLQQWSRRYRLPRPPTHLEPSFRECNGILWRGEREQERHASACIRRHQAFALARVTWQAICGAPPREPPCTGTWASAAAPPPHTPRTRSPHRPSPTAPAARARQLWLASS
jgi:hypothetical protein